MQVQLMLVLALMLVGGPMLSGTFTHTDRTRRFAAAFRAALSGFKADAAAAIQGISPGVWSRQLDADGVTPSLYRFFALPDEMHVAWLKQWAELLPDVIVLDRRDVRDALIEEAYTRRRAPVSARLPQRKVS